MALENGGTPKSSILMGISIINHPFWSPPIFGNTHMALENWMVERLFWVSAYGLFSRSMLVSGRVHFIRGKNEGDGSVSECYF